MHLLTLVLWVSGILTLFSVLLVAVIAGVRSKTDRQVRRWEEFQGLARPLLGRFLMGEASLEKILTLLGKHPGMASAFLMGECSRMNAADRSMLRPLIEALGCTASAEAELTSGNRDRRLRAAETLGYLGTERSAVILRTALGDKVLGVRFAAAEALARLGSSQDVREILKAIDVKGEVSQRRAAEVILILGPAASEPVLSLLTEPRGSVNSLAIAIRVAGSLHLREATEPLRHLLSHGEVNVRLNAVRALASIGDPSAVEAIAPLALDESWEVRSAVMQALGKLEATGHIPLLLRGLSDGQWWVRFNAARALHDLGEAGISALREASEHLTDRFGRDISLQILEEHGIVNKTTGGERP
jgi:HEAT repeat protein